MGIELLNRYINNENQVTYAHYTLDSITELARIFGNPENKFNAIHIAGTNGKGSVAWMLNEILIKSGFKTGLFTSPHLLKINERIKINSVDIADDILDTMADETVSWLDNHSDMVSRTAGLCGALVGGVMALGLSDRSDRTGQFASADHFVYP